MRTTPMRTRCRCGSRRTRTGISVGVGGLKTCASWHHSCLVCGAKIAVKRPRELEHVFRIWRKLGGSVVLATFSCRHNRSRTSPPWAWRCSTAPDADRKVRGIIRGFETTIGDEHGFHPHYHVFLLVEGEITAVGAREALMPAGDRWCEGLAEHGLTAVAAVNGESAGFDVTVMDDAEAGTLARYPFKLALEAAVRETAFGGVFSAAAAPTLTATCWASGTARRSR